MLVLDRKRDQTINIGPDIQITILRLSDRTVRIGIDAPSEVRIIRGELPHSTEPAAENGEASEKGE